MSAGSREGGGNVLELIMPANQNREEPLDSEPKEGKIISLVQKMEVLTRQKEVQQKSSEDLVVEAKSMESKIKKCDISKYEASLRQLAALHSDRIDFLFKDIWCNPDKIDTDPAYAKAVMVEFSFRFSKTNRK